MSAPEGFENVTTSREDRRLIRLSLKLYAEDLRKLQAKDTNRAVTNPVIAAKLEHIAGVSDNQPGLIKRYMLDGDSDPEEPKKEKKAAKKDPRQLEIVPPAGKRGGHRGDQPRA